MLKLFAETVSEREGKSTNNLFHLIIDMTFPSAEIRLFVRFQWGRVTTHYSSFPILMQLVGTFYFVYI